MARRATTTTAGPPARRQRGFERTGQLLQPRLKEAGEKRGFALTRLLTRWAEIVGPALAAHVRPVKVGYAGRDLGATLTVLTTGARAPEVEMQKERIRDKVNAVYGYAAIARVRVTQVAAQGFAEGAPDFHHAAPIPEPGPNVAELSDDKRAAIRDIAAGVESEALRAALEALAANVMTRPRRH